MVVVIPQTDGGGMKNYGNYLGILLISPKHWEAVNIDLPLIGCSISTHNCILFYDNIISNTMHAYMYVCVYVHACLCMYVKLNVWIIFHSGKFIVYTMLANSEKHNLNMHPLNECVDVLLNCSMLQKQEHQQQQHHQLQKQQQQ